MFSSRHDTAPWLLVRLALAADDGSVRLMAAEAAGGGGGLAYMRLLGRAPARALSAAWSADASVVYAGFADGCIRALDVATGALASWSRGAAPLFLVPVLGSDSVRLNICLCHSKNGGPGRKQLCVQRQRGIVAPLKEKRCKSDCGWAGGALHAAGGARNLRSVHLCTAVGCSSMSCLPCARASRGCLST
jgi:hypothetical protein